MSFQWPSSGLSSSETRQAIRQTILEQIYCAKSGHPGGSLSLVEILGAIFDGNFVHDAKDPMRADRDRLVLSKGHGVPALYSWLSRMGYFDAKELVHLREFGHFLQGHPDRSKYPLMEASTGSLGQGASVALGLALGLKLSFDQKKISRLPRVYCVLGDGEMQEGQVWECLMAAGKFKPSNLIFILDSNKGQIDGPVAEVMNLEPIPEKLKAFHWNVLRVDGHNIDAMKTAIQSQTNSSPLPLFIVADTVKGKGVSFMENQNKWHGSAPSKDQLEAALKEILGNTSFGRLV